MLGAVGSNGLAVLAMTRSCYSVTVSQDDVTQTQALALRGQVFRGGGNDVDSFDATATHGVVCDNHSGQVVCCFRLTAFGAGDDLSGSYSAKFYDLTPLSRLAGGKMELGRFAVADGARDPDIIRHAWAAITAELDRRQAQCLFGCSSFWGADPDLHHAVLSYLGARYIGPLGHVPVRKAGQITYDLSGKRVDRPPSGVMAQMPGLLRAYLAMGGWVGDHAVADPDLDTTHVLTVLEVDRVPEQRRARMRELAASQSA